MKSVSLHDKEFILYLEEEKIQNAITEMANKLAEEYTGKDVVFVGVLNGCFRFISDLMKYIEFDAEVNFIKLSSYRGTESTGKISDLMSLNTDLHQKHVVLLEDIVDTGHTLDYLMDILKEKDTASVKVASLLYKPDAFIGKRKPDYVAFEIPNLFVVGYGLDYDGLGRNLNDIYQIKS
ncbi:MAG TPA: hypoxanthine phosphoribosyltransferase [Cryomorphaceae bacterium]|nr:hypoxanthine phosphoribosyltransferase [Cryomorphaceae bacterium]